MQVLAPAKINLSLKILGRREDGFHEIETLIAPISLYDKIEIEKQNRWIDFSCDDQSLPGGDENLVVRAAKLFLEQSGVKGGVSIRLEKKIPHGAGLGGGSSDAAATLVALDDLFETKLPRVQLAGLGAKLGSDVPFFIFGSAARCTGRGEIVTPMTVNERLSILLLKPEFGVASEWTYQRWQDSRELPDINYGIQKLANLTFENDLERPVFGKFVFLAQLKMWLRKQLQVGAALMSGSGSTVFAVLREKADAELLANRAKADLDPQLWTCECETLEVDRPLRGR